MLWVYRLLFVPVLAVLGPMYLLRMHKRGGYGRDFGHRFGGVPRLPAKAPGRTRIWLQAVSVGEILAVGPILEALHRSGVEVFLTTTTSTGHRLARERFGRLLIGLGYFPLDWWPFVARAWRRLQPDLVILAEGERWPELLWQARRRGVPVLNINARISDRSFARMERRPAVARLMLRNLTRLLCVSSEDAARFVRLGVAPDCVLVTGNIKLDVSIPLLSATAQASLRQELGLPPGLVLLGSSTWPGEEAALLEALRQTRAAGVACSLLLVPRHAERRGEIERLLLESGLGYHLRTRGPAPGPVDVAVGDTTGELRQFTQLADVVFVGKSLPPHTEGQTPVEAAALEKPILLGPGMANFRPIARDLLARGAAREVADASRLAAAAKELLQDVAQRERLAVAAGAWRRDNAGALERTIAAIRDELARLPRGPGSGI